MFARYGIVPVTDMPGSPQGFACNQHHHHPLSALLEAGPAAHWT